VKRQKHSEFLGYEIWHRNDVKRRPWSIRLTKERDGRDGHHECKTLLLCHHNIKIKTGWYRDNR